MKIYPSTNVNLTIQNNGSRWLLILRGSRGGIRLNHNGLYNWGATNSSRLRFDNEETATIWSSEDAMHKFFYCQCPSDNEAIANHYADVKIEELRAQSEEYRDMHAEKFGNVFVNGYELGIL